MDYERMEDDHPACREQELTQIPRSDGSGHAQRGDSAAVSSTTTLDFPLMPQNQLEAVRFALGLLLAVLVVAALITVVSVRHYRLIVSTFWAILIVAYVGLAQLLQSALAREERILPRSIRRLLDPRVLRNPRRWLTN